MARQTDRISRERQQALIDAYRAVLARADAIIRTQAAIIAERDRPTVPPTVQAMDLSAGQRVD